MRSTFLLVTFVFSTCTAVLTQGDQNATDLSSPEIVFDFDTDSCYPDAAIFDDGKLNGGLKTSGDITGECRELKQLERAHTYYRATSIEDDGVTYEVRMYALYFEKDQIASFIGGGHRHDWEFALLWLTDGELTHASYSEHGKVITKPIDQVPTLDGKPNAVKIVYHKDDVKTHALRFAMHDETKAENVKREWLTFPLMDWDTMTLGDLNTEALQTIFNESNKHFGKANCSFNDTHFPKAIAKSPPDDYPTGEKWKNAVE